MNKAKHKDVKKRKTKQSYLHYAWQPFAFIDMHLFVFDFQKVEDWKVWKYAFDIQRDHKDNHQWPGMTLFDTSMQSYTCAIVLMKFDDNAVDLSTIVHECTHATQHIVNLLLMNSSNDNPVNTEFGPELCSSLVIKICQVLNAEHIAIVDRYDGFGIKNIVKCKK